MAAYQSKPEAWKESPESLMLLDPALLQAARLIYRGYLEVHCDQMQRPLGVAISCSSRRGYLVFSERPILLPGECFVPFEQMECQLY